MKNEHKKEELPFERVLFFSDAIVAIAITLLALELKIDIPEGQHLHFADLLKPWHQYLAFSLSFINISIFWNMHHRLFAYIKMMDVWLKLFNMSWLFFIVTLPFSTSVLSDHFNDSAAVFLYALTILLISFCQNLYWDYSVRESFVETLTFDSQSQKRYKVAFQLDIINALLSLVVSFFAPVTAFILLYLKLPTMLFVTFFIKGKGKHRLG